MLRPVEFPQNGYAPRYNTYDEIPRSGAMDMFPMWRGNAVYFISDRTGVMNLYRYDMVPKKTTRLTDYKEFDVKWPSLGPDSIAYENGGKLFYYDLERNRIQAVAVSVAGDEVFTRPEIRTVANNIRSFHISPGGVRAVFEAHGDVLTIPAGHGATRNLTDSPGVHEQSPVWSPDGKWIAYLSNRWGMGDLYAPAEGRRRGAHHQ